VIGVRRSHRDGGLQALGLRDDRGADTLYRQQSDSVVPGATVSGGARGSESVHTFRSTDAEAIAKECPAVKLTAPVWGELRRCAENRNWSSESQALTSITS
jgi:hypothetical protein